MKNTVALIIAGAALYNPQAQSISNTMAGGLSAFSAGSSAAIHHFLRQTLGSYDHELVAFLYTLNFCINGIVLPCFFYSYTPKARLRHAREVTNNLIIDQNIWDKNQLYAFIEQNFSEYKWPLLVAKGGFVNLLDKIKKEIKSLDTALRDTPYEDRLLRKEIRGLLKKLEVSKDYVAKIMSMINEHPDYYKMQQAVSEIDAMRDIARAQRFQTRLVWNI